MSAKMSDLGALPRWDLSTVYPGLDSEAYTRDIQSLSAKLDDLDQYLDGYGIARAAADSQPPPLGVPLGPVIGGYLERINAAVESYYTLRTYASLHVSMDSYNALAKRRSSELEILGVRLRQQDVRFRGWMGGLVEWLPSILEEDSRAKAHAFYLQETAEQSRYLMSEVEESLAAELGLSGASAWRKLQGVICSQLSVPFERDGQTERLPMAALQNLKRDSDADVRRRSYEAELAAWESVKEPLASALNGVKGAVGTLNKRRGRDDALHAALDDSRLDRETLEAMLSAMRDSFPAFRSYMRAKAKRLGHENGQLPWWDMFAPLGKDERRFTFPEAQDLIVAQFRRFGARLADFAQKAFDRQWIDAEPRDGKRGGAFCSGLPAIRESRVLCNYDGSLDQVLTIAHELGHAFHNECHIGRTPLQASTPMTLNETASIFCETIVTEAALADASSRDEELAILETTLIGHTQVVVDISSRYQFEKEVFERRAAAELSADEFCEIMLRTQADTYGDGLDERYRHQYMWAWKPHYYYTGLSYYNYPYAFGLLFGTGLYAIYQERGAAFVPDYEALLTHSGEGTAADLAARFDIDLRQPEFWKSSLGVIEKRIHRYLEL